MNKRSVWILSVSVCSIFPKPRRTWSICLILSISVCLAAIPGEAGSGDGQGQESHADQKPRQDPGDTGQCGAGWTGSGRPGRDQEGNTCGEMLSMAAFQRQKAKLLIICT